MAGVTPRILPRGRNFNVGVTGNAAVADQFGIVENIDKAYRAMRRDRTAEGRFLRRRIDQECARSLTRRTRPQVRKLWSMLRCPD